MVNRYDKPAQAQFINAYAPVDFDALYRIGVANKAAVDQAEKELEANIKTFGSFKSLSEKDTQNYYNESIGKLKDLIQTAAANPDAMKSASFRSQLQSRINNIDYAKLSMYKQTAENLNKRAENIARMKAEGLYNPEWDDINMAAWDTDTQKIMSELAPVRYLTANQLSNAYFDNMKPGTLKPVWQNGIKYNVTGNTYEDLLQVAKAHENDLINTPQGAMYMRQFLQQTGGDEAKARELFTDMIAQSQIDRILRPKLEVDPVDLLRKKQEYDNSNNPKVTAIPNRQQKIGSDILSSIQNSASRFDAKAYSNAMTNYNEKAKLLYKELKRLMAQYASDNSEDTFKQLTGVRNQLQNLDAELYDSLISNTVKKAFEETTQTNVNNGNNIDKKDYNRGVRAALTSISSTAAIHPDDKMLTILGGTYDQYTTSSGHVTGEYSFANSDGFILPESIFQLVSQSDPVDNKRKTGWFRKDLDFPLRELVESGSITDVRFRPASNNNIVQVGDNKFLLGEMLISKETAQESLGTGLGFNNLEWAVFPISHSFSSQTTKSALKDLFNSTEITYGKDGNEYYSFPVYRMLPEDSNKNYWDIVIQSEFNTPSQPTGIGSSTEAAAQHPFTAMSLMDN